MTVRVRIAPSPTGNLHIGTARTALFNWLFARKHGGQFILRIEDTDLERSDKKYEQNIIESLQWLGLQWDGEIFRQSERLDLYKQYLEKLLNSGKAFWCHHTVGELEAERQQQAADKIATRHICEHKNTEKGKEKGEIIRLAVDENSTKKIRFNDSIRGQIEWEEKLLGDFSLAKNVGTPLYNLAVVVDDIEMEITHVIRGEDHISNTPKQILIYEALGKGSPVFSHLPMILASDRTKLSKRHGATAVTDYKQDYLPEALNNFMGFLGYTYSKELLSKEEMAQEFELTDVHKSGAIFNMEKLSWINSQYLKQLPLNRLKQLIGHPELPDSAVPLMMERLEKLSDAKEEFNYFWEEPKYDRELLIWKKSSEKEVLDTLNRVRGVLSVHDFNSKEAVRDMLDSIGQQLGNRGLVYWPLRVALSGRDKSPDPVDIAFVLGKEKTLERIDAALRKLV
ncbi:MAG: glutamate--tRNA ligase [Candidatus Yanofskybacteria bacterium]|nr:glutamate--tRNA ligase [Candidatus Yanofskybacteria bacterium]